MSIYNLAPMEVLQISGGENDDAEFSTPDPATFNDLFSIPAVLIAQKDIVNGGSPVLDEAKTLEEIKKYLEANFTNGTIVF